MSITSAITALAPNLYWPLTEGGGSTAGGSGSLDADGAVTGTVDWTVNGPEMGTTAMRLFSGAQIVSPGMDLTVFGNLTLGMWVATDASGSLSTPYPILSIGDVTNRFTRGPVIFEQHSVMGTPVYFGRWCAATNSNATPLVPQKFWHWVCLVIATGPNSVRLWMDGIAGVLGGTSGFVSCLDTDPLLLQCDEPVTVAHVAVWYRALSSGEMLSVANELAPWPYSPPANTPYGGDGGTGGLTEEQAEQLSNIESNVLLQGTQADLIETYTADLPGIRDAVIYISDTVNTINGKVDEALGHLNTLMAVTGEQVLPNIQAIQDAVTRIFITSSGLGLSTPLGSLLAHPDPNLLHAAESFFYISGQGTLTAPEGLGYSNVYGIRWIATTVPPAAGYRDGQILSSVQRLIQWVLFYPDVGELELHPQEIAEFRYMAYTWLWQRPYPNTIQYDVLPGFILRCQYIILAPLA